MSELEMSNNVDKEPVIEEIISNDETKSTQSSDPKVGKKEINGPKGLEPTRYGDWESKGRCVDF